MGTEDPEMCCREAESGEDVASNLFTKRRYCFCIPCFGSRPSTTAGSMWWQKMRTAEDDDRWWTRGLRVLKKFREWSEIVAGPKWKTFIRRFNKNKGAGGGGGKRGKFHYDPLSYALNFDDGPGQNSNSDDDYGYRDFSSRYASIPVSAKTSTDLGKKLPAAFT